MFARLLAWLKHALQNKDETMSEEITAATTDSTASAVDSVSTATTAVSDTTVTATDSVVTETSTADTTAVTSDSTATETAVASTESGSSDAVAVVETAAVEGSGEAANDAEALPAAPVADNDAVLEQVKALLAVQNINVGALDETVALAKKLASENSLTLILAILLQLLSIHGQQAQQ